MSAAVVYVPIDAAACSVGADEVADAISAEADRRGMAVDCPFREFGGERQQCRVVHHAVTFAR